MARFHKGARPSHPDKLAARVSLATHPAVAARLAAHASGNVALPDSVSLAQFEPPIFDQGSTGSCTAAATTAGVAAAFAAAGRPLGFIPSQRVLYAATRAYERSLASPPGQALQPLTDSGAELADVYTVLARYGVRSMLEAMTSDGRFYDLEAAAVNDEPALEDLEAAGQKLVLGPYGVDPTASDASDVLAAALVSGIPVGIATFVDQVFENLQPGQIAGAPNTNDASGGGHALLLDGYQTLSGARVFSVRNSWSASWCDGGRCLAGPAFLASCWETHPLAVVLGG